MPFPAPRPGRWSAKPQRVRWGLRPLPSYASWVCAPVMLWSWFKGWLPAFLGDWPFAWFLAGTALFLAAWLVRLAQEIRARARTRHDRALSDRPEGLEEFVIEAAFNAGGKYLGLDRGVAWFEDGLLHYSGAATSFVLAAPDVAPRPNDVPRDGLLLSTNRARAFVRLCPLAGRGMFAFRRRLRRFLRDAEPVRAARQWPPMAAYGESEPQAPVLFNTPESVGLEAARTGSARGVARQGGPRA